MLHAQARVNSARADGAVWMLSCAGSRRPVMRHPQTAVSVRSISERQRICENGGCLNATRSSEGEAACLIPGGLFFCDCQERHDRVGDGIGGSPGQVMTRAVDELQAGIW